MENGRYTWPIENSNKLPFLEEFCEKHSIKLDEVIAVGDDYNDIPKFKASGFSIAFNTTSAELRKAADVVIESNDLKEILRYIN